MSKYSSYQVRYSGDHAVVTLDLNTPIISRSERPKDKHHRESFEVVTATHSFNQAGIAKAIDEAAEQRDYATQATLFNAQVALNKFIDENGATNPYEAADWEDYEDYGRKAPVLAMA